MRYLTAGESHGPRLTAIIEGVPAGLPLTAEDINGDLKRRHFWCASWENNRGSNHPSCYQ